ncbi:Uncharacterised protein [Mycobacteroides abscessus subsp. abscessus]|uniref:hypothetical protein n=1 Tax=Mycobacteroides abscessus TaxID=36809 RepID=UPI00092AA34B|nr:hypothetical protein [Mycobacteroides abscessus]SHP27371.1 Uncharacterised protein [Mycobacteroides abscessus subsp. abscessus]SHP67005.1 Uncharacterised protein [Mycobacteroides abscessus subsp. abscessus]SHY38555.1 Uncharacterised protein [Mycobacteroides abscessus subsp. abscessus]SKD95029.1 Uncharacterised protein [Mycobacteroides abscessus subsp. abscessus]
MAAQPEQNEHVQRRLNELAELAEACRDAFLRTAATSHWQPGNRSPAAKVAAHLEKLDPAGFTLISEVVITYLEIAAGHLGGIAALYRSGEAMFPPLPLARSVLELTAHAMWVLGKPPATAADVLARAYLEEFTSLETAKQAAGRMAPKTSESHQRAKRAWVEFRERIIAVFPDTDMNELGGSPAGRTIGGQVSPRPEDCVEDMFDHLHAAVGGITMRQASGVYGFLCAGTHPSLFQTRAMRRNVDHGDHLGTILSVDVSHLERLLAITVAAYYNALSYTLDFYGMDRAAHDELTYKIDEVLPGMLSD